jgi:proteasome lid subunit RPN8/RPN11
VRTFPTLAPLREAPLLSDEARSEIARHLNVAPAGRVAGVLLGEPSGEGVRIDVAIRASQVEQYGAEPVLSREVWDAAYAAWDGSGRRIIGWYHSHPPLDPTVMEYDRLLHRALFPERSAVALVLDPWSGQGRWFGWTAGSSDDLSQFESHFVSGHRSAAMGLVVAGLIAAAAAGFGISTAVGHGRGSPDDQQLRAALQRTEGDVAAAQGEIADLHRQLSAVQQELQATRQPTVVMYRVQPGDSLSRLAQAFYGDRSRWKRIFTANRAVITDPNLLPAGIRIAIPLR